MENPSTNREFTIGEVSVGVSFNPSQMPNVDKAKQLMAEAIDLLEAEHNLATDNGNKMASWHRNVFRTAAFNALVAAQMALVKYLTWKN